MQATGVLARTLATRSEEEEKRQPQRFVRPRHTKGVPKRIPLL